MILLVEDDVDTGEILLEFLREMPAETLWARSGAEVREFLRAKPNLVAALVDLTLPDIDGIKVARELRRRFPELRLALVTGLTPASVGGAAASLGARIFEKPTDPDELVAFVRDAVLASGEAAWS
jgi:DNA-binding response OmpR family regulator